VGYGLAFLPLYFLAALSIGYYSGYLLLVSQPTPDRFRAPSTGARAHYNGASPRRQSSCCSIAVPAPHSFIETCRKSGVTNGAAQTQFAQHLTENLPPKGIIISDDPYRLSLDPLLARPGKAAHKDYTFLCSQWLPQPDYQRYLSKIYPKWPTPETVQGSRKDSGHDLTLVPCWKSLAANNLSPICTRVLVTTLKPSPASPMA
jgi:hypothetical protein